MAFFNNYFTMPTRIEIVYQQTHCDSDRIEFIFDMNVKNTFPNLFNLKYYFMLEIQFMYIMNLNCEYFSALWHACSDPKCTLHSCMSKGLVTLRQVFRLWSTAIAAAAVVKTCSAVTHVFWSRCDSCSSALQQAHSRGVSPATLWQLGGRRRSLASSSFARKGRLATCSVKSCKDHLVSFNFFKTTCKVCFVLWGCRWKKLSSSVSCTGAGRGGSNFCVSVEGLPCKRQHIA